MPASKSPDPTHEEATPRYAPPLLRTRIFVRDGWRCIYCLSTQALQIRDLFHIIGVSEQTEVLVDDRPIPYARELWLPLIWFLIPR